MAILKNGLPRFTQIVWQRPSGADCVTGCDEWPQAGCPWGPLAQRHPYHLDLFPDYIWFSLATLLASPLGLVPLARLRPGARGRPTEAGEHAAEAPCVPQVLSCMCLPASCSLPHVPPVWWPLAADERPASRSLPSVNPWPRLYGCSLCPMPR